MILIMKIYKYDLVFMTRGGGSILYIMREISKNSFYHLPYYYLMSIGILEMQM